MGSLDNGERVLDVPHLHVVELARWQAAASRL